MARKALLLPAVLDMTGYSRSTLYQKIKDGKFPAPTKLDPEGRASIWWEDQIEEIQNRAVSRNSEAA